MNASEKRWLQSERDEGNAEVNNRVSPRLKRARTGKRSCSLFFCELSASRILLANPLKTKTYAFYPIEFKELTWLRLNSPTVSGSPKAHKHRKLRRVYYGGERRL